MGDLPCHRHVDGVADIAASARSESGSSAALGCGIGHAREGAREAIPDD